MENKLKYFINPKKEFEAIYFDKLSLLAISSCLKINPEHFIDKEDQLQLIDSRDKNVEACLDKIFALHKIFDDEYNQHN